MADLLEKTYHVFHIHLKDNYNSSELDKWKNLLGENLISLDNYNLELKEIQIQKEIKEGLLKQEKQRQEKEYFNNNFEQIKQQFISSNISNDNELII